MSLKPIAQKLLIKENFQIVFLNEPEGYRSRLGKLPPNVIILTKPAGPVDFVQVFVTSKEELVSRLGKLKSVLSPKGLLWVTYPKGTSKARTDINRDIIRKYAETLGLQAVSMISIDDTWSALRLKIA